MEDFQDKVAVVTGGGGRIGRGICLALAEAGAHVVVADIDEEGAGRVSEEVGGRGVRGIPVATDVSKAESVTALADAVVKEMGGAFSAEHGIGEDKRAMLFRCGGEARLGAMRALKAAFDPSGVLNVGKVV